MKYMKKIVLVLILVLVTACGGSKSDLINKMTKEDLIFKQEIKNICDTTLEVENKLVLSKEKNDNGDYIGSYLIYDCGDGAVYMTENEGTYKVDGETVIFLDVYQNQYKFKVDSKDTVIQLDENKNEVRTLKLSDKDTKSEK